MAQQTILTPSFIQVTEEYVYRSRISGVRQRELRDPTGLIEVIVPYDKRKHFNDGALGSGESRSTNDLASKLLAAQLGELYINRYGHNDLNRQLDINWDKSTLPIKLDLDSHELARVNLQDINRFDLYLTHPYQPDEPIKTAIRTSVHILDEDYIDQQAKASEKEEEMLVEQLRKRAGLKHNLIMRFRIALDLPKCLGSKFTTVHF